MILEGYKQRIAMLWLVVITVALCMFVVFKAIYADVDATIGYGYSYIITGVCISLILAVGVLGSVAFYLEGDDD
jgi:hypothetical protein